MAIKKNCIRITIDIPRDDYVEFKSLCVNANMTMTEVIREFIHKLIGLECDKKINCDDSFSNAD